MCVNACIFVFFFFFLFCSHHTRSRWERLCLRFFTSAILKRQLEDNLKLGGTTNSSNDVCDANAVCDEEKKNKHVHSTSINVMWKMKFAGAFVSQQWDNNGHRLVCAFNRMFLYENITNHLAILAPSKIDSILGWNPHKMSYDWSRAIENQLIRIQHANNNVHKIRIDWMNWGRYKRFGSDRNCCIVHTNTVYHT